MSGDSLRTLNLLAGRPATFSMNLKDLTSPWALLAQIDRITGIFNAENSLLTVRNTLHVSLLGKLWVDALLALLY